MRRLFTRIYLHFVGVLLVVALGATIIGSLAFRGPILHGFAEKLSTHAARLVSDRMEDPKRLASLVTHLSTEFDVDLTVRDPSGKLLVAAGPEQPVPSASDLANMKRGTVMLSRFKTFAAATRIVDDEDGHLLGILEIAPRRHFGAFSPVRPLLGLAGILLLVGLATAPLARRLSRPVDRVIEAAHRFGEGDLAYRIPLPPWCRKYATDTPLRGRRRRPDQMLALMISWNEMADRIQHLVGGHRELLANVSHELRSPLARLRVALELLPKDGSSEARIADLESDLGELERLIDDVLTTSKLEAAGFAIRAEKFETSSIFAQLADRAALDPTLAGKEVRVERASGAVVEADGALLKRALWNLLENAGKYGAAPVTLSVEARDGIVIFRVADEGPGIPEADREKAIAPFYRGDKARTPGAGGFGLGLTLARRIAEAHGGSLRIESTHPDGRGCRAVLTIPAVRVAA